MVKKTHTECVHQQTLERLHAVFEELKDDKFAQEIYCNSSNKLIKYWFRLIKLFKNAKSLYPYNRSQFLQYVKYTK